MTTLSEWTAVLPLIAVLLGGLITMLVDAFSDREGDAVAFAFASLAAGAAISLAAFFGEASLNQPIYFDAYLSADRFALFFDVLICGTGALVALFAAGYLGEHRLHRGEFYVLLIFSALGAMILVRSIDMLTLFLGLETMSLGVYSLCAFRRTSARATESGMKYFLLGSFAAAILLFGAALLYGATGSTSFAGIAEGVQKGLTPWDKAISRSSYSARYF